MTLIKKQDPESRREKDDQQRIGQDKRSEPHMFPQFRQDHVYRSGGQASTGNAEQPVREVGTKYID